MHQPVVKCQLQCPPVNRPHLQLQHPWISRHCLPCPQPPVPPWSPQSLRLTAMAASDRHTAGSQTSESARLLLLLLLLSPRHRGASLAGKRLLLLPLLKMLSQAAKLQQRLGHSLSEGALGIVQAPLWPAKLLLVLKLKASCAPKARPVHAR